MYINNIPRLSISTYPRTPILHKIIIAIFKCFRLNGVILTLNKFGVSLISTCFPRDTEETSIPFRTMRIHRRWQTYARCGISWQHQQRDTRKHGGCQPGKMNTMRTCRRSLTKVEWIPSVCRRYKGKDDVQRNHDITPRLVAGKPITGERSLGRLSVHWETRKSDRTVAIMGSGEMRRYLRKSGCSTEKRRENIMSILCHLQMV